MQENKAKSIGFAFKKKIVFSCFVCYDVDK